LYSCAAAVGSLLALACSAEIGEVGPGDAMTNETTGSITVGPGPVTSGSTGSGSGGTGSSGAGTTSSGAIGMTTGSTAVGTGGGSGVSTSGTVGSGGSTGGTRADAGFGGGGTGGARSDASAGAGGMPRDAGTREGGTGGSGAMPDGAAGCGLANVVTQSLFDAIFPLTSRNQLYTYDGFIAAATAYPAFVNTGSVDTCRKEAAAFLANVARETGRLRYAEQIAKSQYCSSRNSCACDPNTQDQTKWYYGRGPIQISWNYNYCAAGAALGVDLLSQPNIVSTNSEVAWKTALWFWMTQEGAGNMTCHAAMTGTGGFGETIRTINGGQECSKGGYGAVEGVTERVDHYIDYAKRLGIANPGTPQDNDC
jgi:predicted chitinase